MTGRSGTAGTAGIGLEPGVPVDLLTLQLEHASVPTKQDLSGSTTTAAQELGSAVGLDSTGVWEMSEGVMTDTERDELFLVVAGEGTVEFLDPALPPAELRPGAMLRLSEGMQTRWTVHRPLRKLYLS